MSGLLRRLASSAVGTQPRIRSVSRLPFAPAPALVEEVAATRLSTAEPLADGAPARKVANRELTPDPSPRRDSSPPRLLEPAAPSTARVAEPRPVLDEAPFWQPAHQPAVDARPASSAGPHIPPPIAPEPASSAVPAAPGLPPRERNYEVPAISAKPVQRPPASIVPERSESRFIGPEVSAPTGRPPVEPPLLIPAPQPAAELSIVVPTTATRYPAQGFPRSTSGQVEEITEVHVNIGRIEVTAAPEPPRKPHRTPSERRAMSLEEYLARRQGGSR